MVIASGCYPDSFGSASSSLAVVFLLFLLNFDGWMRLWGSVLLLHWRSTSPSLTAMSMYVSFEPVSVYSRRLRKRVVGVTILNGSIDTRYLLESMLASNSLYDIY